MSYPRNYPSRSRADYTGYEFTASSGFDYNYDPVVGGRTLHSDDFDPYVDELPSLPVDLSSGTQTTRNYTEYERRAPDIGQNISSSHIFDAPPPPATSKTISEDYIRESEKPSEAIHEPSSSRKLLVLDLNGTLLYRSPHVRDYRLRQRRDYRNQRYQAQTPLDPPSHHDPYADPTATRPLRPVHARPYLTSFRDYVFHPLTKVWLDTMVWSSAQPHSVADMVEKCFKDKKDGLLAVWARDTLGLDEREYHRKAQTTKDLAKPWAELHLLPGNPTVSSISGQVHSAHTTLLLDDSPLKAHLQPWNHLCIREYVGELRSADLAIRALEEGDEAEPQVEDTYHKDSGLQPSTLSRHDAEKPSVDGFKDMSGSTHAPDDCIPGEEMVLSKKRRIRPKKKKKAVDSVGHPARQHDPTHAPDSDSSIDQTPTYDQTLLAVIGILDSIKFESNVAGWMRNDGLRIVARKAQANNDRFSPSNSSRVQKKRRVNSEELDEPFMPTADFIAAPSGSDQWYEHYPTMVYWVKRGKRALHELEIELVSGVEG